MLKLVTLIASLATVGLASETPVVKQGDYTSKGQRHLVTWMSLGNCLVPYFIYSQKEKNAYREYYGEERPEDTSQFMLPEDQKEHFTVSVRAWEKLMNAYVIAFGPAFVTGLFSLSDVLEGLNHFVDYLWLSNASIPAYIWGLYELIGIIVSEEDDSISYGFLFAWSSFNIFMFGLQAAGGYGIPSLFELLNWV